MSKKHRKKNKRGKGSYFFDDRERYQQEIDFEFGFNRRQRQKSKGSMPTARAEQVRSAAVLMFGGTYYCHGKNKDNGILSES